MKVHLWPAFRGEDMGDGGIRRVVESQLRALPAYGWDYTAEPGEADVLACHIEVPPAYLMRYPDKPAVAHIHGLYWSEYQWENWALQANAKVMEAVRVADLVTAPSEWVAQAIRRHSARDVRVVPHGIEAAEWAHAERVPDGLLLVVADTDEAAARALQAGEPYVLWNKNRADPVCDPAPMNTVAAMLPDVRFVSTYGERAPNVAVTGRLPFADAKGTVEAAAVYLCPTRETFGVGTLEALAAGVPVVGWRWGGQAEIIEHGVDGWLAEPGDHGGLAEGIVWALKNREGLACRAKAEQYPHERAAALYAESYADAVRRRTWPAGGMHFPGEPPVPRVSVIVTAHKLERFLPDTLDSVAAQTAEDWECVVVDDASPDRCGEIADSYAARDPRFRVVHNAENQYLAAARNTGIAASRGRYILPLDADDMLAPTALEVLAGELDRQRAVHVAYGGVLFVDEDGRTPTVYAGGPSPGHSRWPVEFRHEWQLSPPPEGSDRPPNLLPYCSMFRREAWELTGGYRSRCRTAEDADFWCRLSSYGFRPKKVTTTDTLIYRNREDSMSRRERAPDWSRWFPWARAPHVAPSGAVTEGQLPVPSCDPPAIAVVIPVGPGHARYVLDAIDSVDAQTFRQWECIVVWDSPEPAPPLPSWVRVICGDRACPCQDGDPCHYRSYGTSPAMAYNPGGVAAARNTGIAAARSVLYLPLDADDYLEPDALQEMWEEWRRTGDIIYPDFWEDPEEPGRFTHWELPDYDPAYLVAHGSLHSVVALTPVAAHREVGGYDETLPGWEDWAFQIACAERCICSHRYAAPLFTYRKHTGQRRDENYARFEESKAGIVAKFGEYWNGGKTMGGCNTCGGNSYRPVGAPGMNGGPDAPGPSSEAVLLRYIGPRQGATPYVGESGTIYYFAAGDERYVLTQDMPATFAGRPDFEVVRHTPSEVQTPIGAAGPTLEVSGPPSVAQDVPAAPSSPPAEAWGPAVDAPAPREKETISAGDVGSLDEVLAPTGRPAEAPTSLDFASAMAAAGAQPKELPSVEEAAASAQTAEVPGAPPESAAARVPSPRPGGKRARA